MSQETDHPKAGPRTSLEEGIAEWRSYLRRRQAIHSVDADELEDHLRSQASALVKAGLTEDEAFLIAVKRLGELDALSREAHRLRLRDAEAVDDADRLDLAVLDLVADGAGR